MSKILIAEDDRFLRAAYQAKLTKSGFEIQTATDGEEAIEILKTFTPDLILLDLIMPKKNGFAVLEDISKNPSLAKIPVIVSTNLGQKEDRDRALSLGAKEFIVKSDISPDQLIEKIRHYLG